MIQRLCTLYFARKQLILLKKSDLSTEKNPFTITTIFIYRSIVNRQKKRQSGDISKKHAKSVKKKSQRRHRDPLPNRLPGITLMPASVKKQRSWSLNVHCQTRSHADETRQTCHYSKKSHDFCFAVWISACISTGRDVGKVDLCPQPNFYPKQVLRRYNACAPTFLWAKSMIFRWYTDLSTKKWPFTITTIFMYTSLFKTQRQTRTVEKSSKRLFSPCKPFCNSKNL